MFDPTLPLENTPADAAQMRDQLNGLKALIDSMLTITNAQVDGVTTLDPGLPASVNVNATGNTLHLSFEIPRGSEGQPGLTGEPGAQGAPFAQALVDGVTTLDPGTQAVVSVTFDGSNVRFNFGIPRGADGMAGATGPDGLPGPQGAPGEVSAADLINAVNTTSANSNAVGTTGFSADTSYNQTQFQTLIDKMDELITALRR